GSALGFRTVWQRETRAALAASSVGVLLDGLSLDELAAQDLAYLVAAADARPVVLLLDFPRWQELAVACELGAGAVIAKPFLLGDLEGPLARLLPPAKRFAAA
ncbi:MAG TPA: hypothetical protein VL096_05715, partial [Pirellulaceae bacterium]|nr:hypothetical protein [Pirellulaceae bacterium]